MKKIKVEFSVHVYEDGKTRFNEGRLRAELSLFAQHILEAYDETLLDLKAGDTQIHYPQMPNEVYMQ